MIDEAALFADADPEFEESIRIDRELETEDAAARRDDRYTRYLDTYHLTDASVDFLHDLIEHAHADRPNPDERNHWLYGYYGSGKSHLLTTLDLLFDTRELADTEMESVWSRFDAQSAYPELGEAWQALHDDVMLVPLPINLLRYQSVREQSFSEIILQTVYEQRGFASRLDVAFFEEEFQQAGGLFDTRSVWENRETLLNEILREEGVEAPDYSWDDVRKYRILSDLALERLTERATGMTDNLADIQTRNVGQQLAVDTIEAYRRDLQANLPAGDDRTVKIVLLMDEVTLFIGGDYSRLSELNALAESIKDVGDGNILSVVTAQSKIEDVQPGLATKQLDFGILKDRFPQQYELPSYHVGEIVQQRLLAKSPTGRDWLETEALTAPVRPESMLVYNQVGQNTEPPLNELTETQFRQYYPLLPYQPALFLEILSNLRDELADATKSIFSGTARALLALVAGLRDEWTRKEIEKPIISLVDFYDLVQYELEDIIPEKTDVIQVIEHDDEATTAFDVKVAKVVLLLSYAPDMIPQTDGNLAVAVMDDLDGQPRANVATKVRESLEGSLEKYVRPDTSSDGSELRLTDREEQELISEAHDYEVDPEWDAILTALDTELWEAITDELTLPETYRYGADDEEATAYPVEYQYTVDGHAFETGGREDAVFTVDVVIRGLNPEVDNGRIAEDTLYWFCDTEGIDDLRAQLTKWWALRQATRGTNPPESLVRDLRDAAARVQTKLVSALNEGSFRVEASEFDGFDAALADCIDEAYPPWFHPLLSQLDESHLQELRRLDDGAELPDWAQTIGVPPQSASGFATFSDLAFEVRKLVGTEVENSDGELDVATILDRVTDAEPLLATESDGERRASAATLAVLWGLCRADVFRVRTIEGEPAAIDDILTRSTHTTLTVRASNLGRNAKEVFLEYDLIAPTATANTGYLVLDELLDELERRANSLAEAVRVRKETTFQTESVATLLAGLETAAEEVAAAAADRRDDATTDEIDELDAIVSATTADEAWLTTAETRWEERLPFFLQLEGLLRLSNADIEWVGETMNESLEALAAQTAEATDVEWWAEDEWKSFVRQLEARLAAIEAVDEAWATQQRRTDLEAFTARLDHPWLVPPMELPTHSVHDSFQATYLEPLRNTRAAVDRIATVLTPLSDPEPSVPDEEPLTQALGLLDTGIEWSAVMESTIDDHQALLSTLDAVVGDATPAEVTGIGLLYGDADALEAQVQDLDGDAELPELIEREDGVVLR